MHFPSAYFFVFPGCFLHPAGGVHAAQPVVWRSHTRLAILQSSFAYGFLRVIVTAGNCPLNQPTPSAEWVKGRCPLWGAGVKPRMVPHVTAGNCSFATPTTSAVGSRARPWCRGKAPQGSSHYSGKLLVLHANHFRSWVQGTALVQWGNAPHVSPSHTHFPVTRRMKAMDSSISRI